MPMISIQNMILKIERHCAIEGLTLTLAPGEVTAVLGPSGSGKSSLLRAIAGLLPLHGGSILEDGGAGPAENQRFLKSPDRAPAGTDRRAAKGMLFQSLALWPHWRVRGNLEFVLGCRGVPKSLWGERIESALQAARALEFAERWPDSLSLGEAQRAALARAWVDRPPVLLLDEPFSHLDPGLRWALAEELRRYAVQERAVVLWVSHQTAEALTWADKILLLDRGRSVAFGTPRELESLSEDAALNWLLRPCGCRATPPKAEAAS